MGKRKRELGGENEWNLPTNKNRGDMEHRTEINKII